VSFEDVADKVGRPSRRWLLTAAGNARFPDRHADLTVQLIAQARAVFGEAGLDLLIGRAKRRSRRTTRWKSMASRAWRPGSQALADARDAEGYMAETEAQDDGSVLLIENHCPICAAARECQNFCRSELDIFQRVMGDQAGCQVERAEGTCCPVGGAVVYVIRPVALIKDAFDSAQSCVTCYVR
jgi:predicted ArsR family transcriptional regulator